MLEQPTQHTLHDAPPDSVQFCPRSVLFQLANSLLIARIPNAGATGPVDCIAAAAPQLQGLQVSRPFGANEVGPAVLSPAASLPTSLTSLSLEGYSAGFEPHLSQLASLWWQPMERYGRVRFPNEAIEGLSQVGGRAGGCRCHCGGRRWRAHQCCLAAELHPGRTLGCAHEDEQVCSHGNVLCHRKLAPPAVLTSCALPPAGQPADVAVPHRTRPGKHPGLLRQPGLPHQPAKPGR